MMTITLRLPDNMVHIMDMNAHALHMTRNEYVQKLIIEMNHEVQESKRKQKLINASKRVRQESMIVNAEFSNIENDAKV